MADDPGRAIARELAAQQWESWAARATRCPGPDPLANPWAQALTDVWTANLTNDRRY